MGSRPILRAANVSGATGDAPHAMARMVREGDVDVITGDWLSEMNIAWNAIEKAQDSNLGYEVGFLDQLGECIDEIARKGIRVVTNAGALNPVSLTQKVNKLCESRGLSRIVVATVVGDDILHHLDESAHCSAAWRFPHLDHTDLTIDSWADAQPPSSAVAYLGAFGIVEALSAGAHIVICGRVTDASPVIGAAAWWYGWPRTAYDELAGALIAGHLIECGPYVVGGNFSGFKEHLSDLTDIGFPIAEIEADGTCYITKAGAMNGVVNKFNVTAQLLYELQGEEYLNPDVVADMSRISVEETSMSNRVRVSGATGSPPPATAKAMIARPGGYQAEAMYYLNGLDVAAKAAMMRAQLNDIFKEHNFSKLSIELYGQQSNDPNSQQAGTAMLRVFAQARRKEDIAADRFKRLIYALRMQSYPGYHMNLDFRLMDPKPFMELFPSLIPQDLLQHRTLIPKIRVAIDVPPPPRMSKMRSPSKSYETAAPVDLDSFGEAVEAPLGSIVHARSGDKANNSNVGFFVRHKDEYAWLQSLLTVERLCRLLGDDYAGQKVERVEFPLLLAVHFRILDFLDGGIASSARIDGLGKGVGEFLRSRHVPVPLKFLRRGMI